MLISKQTPQTTFGANTPSQGLPLPSRPYSPGTDTPKDVFRRGFPANGATSKVSLQGILAQIPYRIQLIGTKGAPKTMSASQAVQTLKQASTIGLGDLHGSTLRLFEFLLYSDTIKILPEKAQAFIQLQKKLNALTSQAKSPLHPRSPILASEKNALLDLYKQSLTIIATIQPNPARSNRKIVLLGDEIGDRGASDPLMMALVERLESISGTQQVIRIASNHGHSVLPALFGKPGQQSILELANKNVPHIASYFQDDLRLQASCIRALQMFERKALLAQYHEYFKNYRLLEYDDSNQVLYTHAPIRTNNIKELIKLIRDKEQTQGKNYLEQLHIQSYEDIHAGNLKDFVQSVNDFYRDYIDHVFRTEQLDPEIERVLFDQYDVGFLWTIQYPENESELPFKGKGVRVFVHGHHLVDEELDKNPYYLNRRVFGPQKDYGCVNLDNTVYKDPRPSQQVLPSPEESPLFVL